MRRLQFVALGLSGLMVGCAEGRTPPEPTGTVLIPGGPLDFGAARPCFTDSLNEDICADSDGVSELNLEEFYPQVALELDDFYIDVHEVTNLQYEFCVASGECDRPEFQNAVASSQRDYYENEEFNDFPVVNVTFDMARQYCAFVDKRLPTEAEWERAAKGPDVDNPRPYPAEDVTDRLACRSKRIQTRYCANGDQEMESVPRRGSDGGYSGTTEDLVVDTNGTLYNLYGNAAEWVDSWYDKRVNCRSAEGEDGNVSKDPPCTPVWKCGIITDDPECHENAHSCPAPGCDAADGGCFYGCGEGGLGDENDHELTSVICAQYGLKSGGARWSEDEIWPTNGVLRVVRGGSVSDDGNGVCFFTSSGRREQDPIDPKASIGFRCADDP